MDSSDSFPKLISPYPEKMFLIEDGSFRDNSTNWTGILVLVTNLDLKFPEPLKYLAVITLGFLRVVE